MPTAQEDESGQVPVFTPMRGCLTSPDDPTVGGGGWPYAGIGHSGLEPEQQQIGAEQRIANFPNH